MAAPWELQYEAESTGTMPWEQQYGEGDAQIEAAPWEETYQEAPKPQTQSLLGKAKDYLTPRMTAEDVLDPKLGSSALAFGLTGATLTPGGPLAKAGGFIAGAASAYLFEEAYKREVEKFRQMGMPQEDAEKSAMLSTNVLGLGMGIPGSTGRYIPRVKGELPPIESPPAGTTPIDPVIPSPLRIPEPSIQDLARAHQERMLSSVPDLQVPKPGPGLYEAGPIETPGVSQIPTGSVVRPQQPVLPGKPVPQPTQYDTGGLTQLETGSLLKHKPDKATTIRPYIGPETIEHAPPLPINRPGPREAVDNPRILSAEEMLQARRRIPTAAELERDVTGIKQQQLWIQKQIDDAKFMFDQHINSGNDPATLPTQTVANSGQGVPNLYDSLTGHTSGKTKLPDAWIRATTEMGREMGNTGALGRNVELVLHEMNNKPERLLDQWKTNHLVRIFDKWVGRSKWYQYHNPFKLPSTTKEFNMSPKDIKEFVDYAYTGSGRYGPILEPSNPKIKGLVDELFKQGLLDVENHPGVRQAHIRTLDGPIPVGEPGELFYPHNPVAPHLKQGLSGKVLNIAYEQAKKKGWKGYRYEDNGVVKHDDSLVGFTRWLNDHPNNGFRRFAGLELGRTLDATMGGTRRPSEVLAELGYGTDPVNDLMHWVHGTLRRGEQILAEPTLMKLWNEMREELISTNQDVSWLDAMIQRATGHDIELADKYFGDFVSKLNNATNLGLLKLSGIQQINQASYILQRFGFTSTVSGLLRLPQAQRDLIMTQSGAKVATLLQMFTKPTDIFGNLLQRQLQVIGMTPIDQSLRISAALAGDMHLRQQMAMVTHPIIKSKPHLKQLFEKNFTGLLREFNFPEAEIQDILRKGELTIDQRLRYAQSAANFTQGRIGYRGQPAGFADLLSPGGRLFRNLKNFMFSNWVEDARALNEARKLGVHPMVILNRAARGTVGAVGAGMFTVALTSKIKDFIDQQEKPMTPKYVIDTFGDFWGPAVQGFVAGKGNIVASMLLAMSDSLAEFIMQLITPAAFSLAARDFDKLMKAYAKGDIDYVLNIASKYIYGGNIVEPPPPREPGVGLPKMGMGLNEQ